MGVYTPTAQGATLSRNIIGDRSGTLNRISPRPPRSVWASTPDTSCDIVLEFIPVPLSYAALVVEIICILYDVCCKERRQNHRRSFTTSHLPLYMLAGQRST